MVDKAKSYLNQYNIGFTIPGQCVAFVNQIILDVFDIRFPIQGAQTARQLLTATNTRPDLFEQVKNDPNQPTQVPSSGDIFVLGEKWGGWNPDVNDWNGHTGIIKEVGTSTFTAIEQNFVPNKVTEQTHTYNALDGWIHIIKQGEEMATEEDIKLLFWEIFDRDPSKEQYDFFVGKELSFVIANIFESEQFKNQLTAERNAFDQVNKLTEENKALKEQIANPPQNPDQVIITKDSLWAKFKKLIGA